MNLITTMAGIKRRKCTESVLDDACVPKRYHKVSFDAMPEMEYKHTLTAWAEHVVDRVKNGDSMLIVGPHGTGKTSAAVCVMKAVLQNWGRALFTTASELHDLWKTNPSLDEYTSFKEAFVCGDLVVIDDVGLVSTPWYRETLEWLVRLRYNERKSTILTANAKTSDAGTIFGEGVISILRECGTEVVMEGYDWRAK